MLEDYAAYYLQKYIGKYVKGVSKEALKISAWRGNVELQNMELKPEALVELKLPIKVKAGFLGSLKLKVPWSKLGQEPVIVEIDRIYVLAEPSFKVEGTDDAVVQEARYQYIKDAETSLLNGNKEEEKPAGMNTSWIGSLIGTIIANIKLSVTNIHIRYEDTESNPGHPFACGVTLEKLAAVTVDENGKEIFVSGGQVDKVNKSGELKRLAVYFDSNCQPWDVKWEGLTPQQWSQVFEPGINAEISEEKGSRQRHFLLQPVDGIARYKKLGNQGERTPDKPAQSAKVTLEDVTLCLSETQYRDTLKFVDQITTFTTKVQYAHIRPSVSLREDPRAWWQYALKATMEQIRKGSGRLNWEELLRYARLRKTYVSLYAKLLLENPHATSITDNEEIRQLDRDVDKDVVVQWRLLAHTLADQARSQTAQKDKEHPKKSWWQFGWGGQSGGEDAEPRNLTDEDWKQLNEAIGYEEGKPSSVMPGHDAPNMLHTVLEVGMHYNASKLLSEKGEEILDLSCEVLQTTVKLYSQAKDFDLKLQSYKIRSPEGLLGESESQLDALSCNFRYQPVDEDLDWSLSAKASPCYITYYKSSVDRVTSFFQNKSAVSREVAIQTAAALQMTLDDVAKKTQQQLNDAMRNKPKFSLFLDIAAPKLTIPTEFCPRPSQRTQLMVDLGHFTMKTETAEEQGLSGEEKDLYMCFRMQLNDVSAFLVDGQLGWDIVRKSRNTPGILQMVQKCGVVAAVQQICAPHPLHPNTRVAVRLPSLAVDFSPARYHRVMQIVEVFKSSSSDDAVRPWDPADFEGNISVLTWKGMGNREAVWKQRYGALAGPFLYLLESPSSQGYEHCASLIGKQVYAVPPEAVGGVEHVLAICDADQFSKKIVESVNAFVLRFEDDQSLNAWRGHFTAAIRKVSSSQAFSRASEIKQSVQEGQAPTMKEKEVLFLSGALDELKLRVSTTKGVSRNEILLGEEVPLLEMRAIGSKVEFVMRENDMGVGAALLSLEIEDKWHGQTSSSCRFLARSTINSSKVTGEETRSIRNEKERRSSGTERFFDSEATFEHDESSGLSRRSSSQFYDADSTFNDSNAEQPPAFVRTPGLLPKLEEGALSYERNQSLRNFIKAQVIVSSPEAPQYKNIDKQVKVSLTTLAFFVNRPTLLAIMGFVTTINADVTETSSGPQESSDEPKDVVSVISPADVHESDPVATFDRKDSVVKGLLGTGKSRVLFLLVLDMDRAQVILNGDDGAQLGTLSQENLHVTVKMFPSTYAVSAALGNLRLSDDGLREGHPYYYFVDMRDPAGKSFVELEFISYNADDDDYQGFEFCLSGKLSEVRVVYLNRFIQEMSAYFMGMVPANADYMVKLKDKVTDAEKNFTQSEVEGAPALKLDVSLERPVILFPRDTNSNSFLELDILHIQVSNTFQWLGGGKEDIDAVRLETDVLKIEDIHLVVSVNGETGENIIRESSGIFVVVRRTLRDLQHQLPAVDAAVELKTLKAGLSDKEFQVMMDCFTGNLSEVPRLPPPLSNTETDGSQGEKDKGISPEEGSSQDGEAQEAEEDQGDHSEKKVWTTVKVTADVSLVELHLFSGRTKDTALASIQISSVWAAFRMTTDEEKYVMLTLDAVSVTDDREGVEPELRFMIGKADNVGEENSRLVMLVMDAKIGPASQMITLRLQRPRVLLALDFLLAVAEFFIPSVADMIPSGNANDETPYDMKHWVFLDKSPYIQELDEVELSTKHALVADHENIEKYVYDGKGGRLRLTRPDSGNRPLIMVGHGKSLRFRNIIIQNAGYLETSLLLGSNSSYSVSQHDGVYLEYETDPDDAGTDQQKPNNSDKPDSGSDGSSVETTFDLQAIGPELMMYAASLHSSQIRDRLLCARMDMFSRLVMKANDIEISGKIDGFSVEGRRGLYALEPIDSHFRYSKVSGKQNIHLSVSDIASNLTFTTLQLILKLQEDAQSFLLLTSKKITVQCTEFDKIWVQEVQVGSSQIAFWRPRVPPGFAVLGDCLTVIDEPPSKGVLALNMNLAHVKRPEGFILMWSSGGNEECSVWLPKAPKGYVALGCVVASGSSPPQPTSVLCVAKHLVTQWYMRDCIVGKTLDGEQSEFWRAGNSTGSFFHVTSLSPPFSCFPYELRHVALDLERADATPPSTANASQTGEDEGKILFTNTTRFKLVWWDKDAKSKKPVSIWRPVMPAGCALFGDIAVEGYEPPGVAFVPVNAENALLQKPVKFMKLGELQGRKGVKSAAFWLPVAPPGYVALGCLTGPDFKLDDEASEQVRCVRNDLVREAQFSSSSLWDGKQIKNLNQDFSIWPLQVVDTESKASTFVVNVTLEPPPKHLSFELKDLGDSSDSDNIVGDVEIKKCLATVYDDFGGLMIPLANVSLNDITTSVHGKADLMKTTTNFSLLANTYNGKLDSWEPLIENTEAHLSYSQESFPFSSSSLSQVSIAVTSSLNINLSTANLNLLLGAYESWNKLQSIESSMKEGGVHGHAANQILEHEHEKMLSFTCYNNLGQQLFCRLLDDNCDVKVASLSSGQTETFRIPSMMSLRDPATRKAIKQKNVKLLSFKIGTAEIPRDGGFGGRQYMVALRVIPQLQTADQHQLQYQSARTRCMNPSDAGDTVSVSWEEVFIFELELTKSYSAELLITDFAKGAAVGYCSVPLEIFDRRDFQDHEPWSSPRMERHSLYAATTQQGGSESIGWLSVGYKYLSTGTEPEDENLRDMRREDLDIGSIQIALSDSGPWTKLYLNLASKSSYINISGDIAASELTMEGGNKHLTIRSPVVIKNETSLRLDVSLFPQSATRNEKDSQERERPGISTIEEEVFENQRYQPLAGWGSSWPGHLMPTDPGRWSSRDLSNSSQEFPNVELPLGWEWSSDWYVDGANSLDDDGWVYAFSFKKLTEYPFPTSSEKMSFVRRRRWVRKRHRTSTLETARCVLGTLSPGEATAMPIACFREARQDYILQLKPAADDGDADYGWTQVAVYHEHGQKKPSAGDIHVRSLLKDQALSSCLLEAATPTRSKWFCMDVGFTDIGRDVHAGIIKDCELTVTAPLKIMNHLPMSAEYCIFYASRVRGYKLLDKGRVASGETAEIYNADVRKAVYLYFIPEGSWEHQKDPALISHPYRDAANSMTLQNVATKRTITVHIEYDYEEKEATSRILRISVPYWVDCSKCPPLRLRILHIASETKSRCLPESSSEPELLESIPENELQSPYIMVSPFNPRVSGFSASLAVDDSGIFGPIAPLADLEEVDGTVELIAFDGTRHFRLLVSTTLCPIKFAHTKVVTIRPYVTFTNRFGKALLLKQASSDDPNTLATSDWRKSFPVSVVEESAMLQVCLESSQWSFPIRIDREESLHFYLLDENRTKQFVRMEIRGHQEGSRYVVVFRKGSFRGSYRVDNRTASKKIRFRQLGTLDDDWELLYPSSTRSLDWRDPCGQQVLELLPENVELDKSIKVALEDSPKEQHALDVRVRVVQIRHLSVIKITDADEGAIEEHQQTSPRAQQGLSQLKVVLDVGRVGVSIIDQRPQEILFLFMQDFKFSVLFSSQEHASRFKLRVGYLQLDDQNLLTPLPVIFAPESRELAGEEYVFKATISMLDNEDDATKVYPHFGVWVTKRAWCVNVHEPVIWTALAMYSNLHLDVLSGNSEVVGVDPEIRINLIDCSEARLKLTLQTETSQRPRGLLGIWSPVVSLLGNTSKMPIHISGGTVENRYMRQSEISTLLLNHLRKDIVHQAFLLLFGVNVLGMASSTLETLSKTAADLSRDDQFRQVRTKQDRLKHLNGVSDGILRGGEALARGFAFGLSGVVTKPVSNARQHGVTGFFQGVGKAFAGFVLQPISGVLDFIALTIDGVNISYTRCFDAFTHDQALTRMRLPRAIRGDGIILPYDERAALGQAMMQLAEAHNFGQNVVFKDSAKFSLTDFYEDHFELPENKVAVISNRRVMLLTQPSSYKSIRNVVPSKPCRLWWEVPFTELLTLEVARKSGGQTPVFVILHLRNNSKTFAQAIKCFSSTDGGTGPSPAEQLYSSIESRWRKYGPERKALLSQMMRKQSKSMPTPRASKRVFVSDEERSKSLSDASDDSASSSRQGEQSASEKLVKEVILFEQIWRSEEEPSACCSGMASDSGISCTIWRPIVPEGYVSVGDVAYRGTNPPTVTASYKNKDGMFAQPTSFHLVWRNWKDGLVEPITIWRPVAPTGYVALGCVAVSGYMEPEPRTAWCARQDILETSQVEEQPLWQVTHPWHCYIHQVRCEALTFLASRERKAADSRAHRVNLTSRRREGVEK